MSIEFIEEELRDADYREFINHSLPCDHSNKNGEVNCPFKDYESGSERCKVFCKKS